MRNGAGTIYEFSGVGRGGDLVAAGGQRAAHGAAGGHATITPVRARPSSPLK